MTTEKEWWEAVGEEITDHYIKTHSLDFEPDRVAGEVDTFLEAASEFIDINYSTPILETYAGIGPHARELAQRGFRDIVLTDFSFSMVQRANRLARGEMLQPHLFFTVADARYIPLRNSSFKLSICFNTSYIGFFDAPEDNIKVMEETRRILEPGGVVVFDLVNEEYALTKLSDIYTEQVIQGNLVTTKRRTYREDNGRTFSYFTETVQSLNQDTLPTQNQIKIEIFHPSQVLEMLRVAGFSEVRNWSRSFEYDPTGGTLGTRGVKDLYAAVV